MPPFDVTKLTIGRAAQLIRVRDVSPLELTEAYLGQIEHLNPILNAYITVTPDRALADARRATDEIMAGRYRGPLHGIPIALKDLFATAGIRTTAGAKFLADSVPALDSTVARKLREAGTVLLGKTNTHELAFGGTTNNPHYGPTRNPWKLDRIPGGSSGGSGAAVAAGMACGTTGTDTAASIRLPAAFNGVVGLKPTYGRVSKAGVVPVSFFFDHPGPITRTVEDSALMLEAMAGYDPDDCSTVPLPVEEYTANLRDSIRGLRVGVPRDWFFDHLDDEVRVAVEAAIVVFRDQGAAVRDVTDESSLEPRPAPSPGSRARVRVRKGANRGPGIREARDKCHQRGLFLHPARLQHGEGRKVLGCETITTRWWGALPAHAPRPFGEERVDERAAHPPVRERAGGDELLIGELGRGPRGCARYTSDCMRRARGCLSCSRFTPFSRV